MISLHRPAEARERVEAEFATLYGGRPDILVRAPGRVNLIGEHTDYNDGFVLPVAIDRELWIALRPRADGHVYVHSVELGGAGFSTDGFLPGTGWIEYVKGIAWALREAGHCLSGWDGVLCSDIPIGAGLSSSSALQMAVLRAFMALIDVPWQPGAAARIGQRVENDWIGVQSGIMDPLVIAAGRRDHALLIDCRSLDIAAVLLPPEAVLVVLDTGTRRGLLRSAYNERRRQCEEAACWFEAPALRDVDAALLAGAAGRLDERVRRRARHVISENERTLEAAQALRSADLNRFGQLMNESHISLRDDFEVSTGALDAMVGFARRQPGCWGVRMTGAGFGGCVVAMVERDFGGALADRVTTMYRASFGFEARAYLCGPAEGASIVETTSRSAL